MASLAATQAIRAEVALAYTAGPIVEANDFRQGLETGSQFLLLLYPPTIHRRMNVGQPPYWEESGAFSLRLHIPSGDPIEPGREILDQLQTYFRERRFSAPDGTEVHTVGQFSGYEGEEPEGNWFELHLAVPFWRQYQGEERTP